MANFSGDIHSFKPSPSFLGMDSNIELINQFGDLNPSFLQTPNLHIQNTLGFSNDNFLTEPQPAFPINLLNSLPSFFGLDDSHASPVGNFLPAKETFHQESKKRRVIKTVSDTSSGNSYAPATGGGITGNRKNTKKGKRGKNIEKESEKPKDVIHVRAKRGQATDSHSLAERVRREKINEKLRCLQDLVPGCYKTMGMSVMLDEIITYVQSLQNQVEFLSMKLTAASSFYDFNTDTEVTETIQGTNAYDTQALEKLVREGGYGGLNCFNSTWPL
ncbi:hypothetical protein ACHQM5_009171 [Ranunculus cassubicifolius]